MRLYHFTSLGHLPVILATGGLWRGEVPVGDGTDTLRGTWLTTDPDPAGHGLDGSGVDKRAVRLTVVIPERDRDLRHWLRFTRHKQFWLQPDCVERLVRTGGGKRKAETWYVYMQQLPVDEFRVIECRQPDGNYAVPTPEQVAAMVPHEGLHDDVVEEFREIRQRQAAATREPTTEPAAPDSPVDEALDHFREMKRRRGRLASLTPA